MSRPSALRETLKLPSTHTLEVVSVLASGDCFYDCIHELLIQYHAKCGSLEMTLSPLLRSYNSTTMDEVGDGGAVPSSQSMRNYVAEQLTVEQLDLYKMYAMAGLDEYKFSITQTLEELKQFAKRSGRTNGPGKCFWADEFALRTISDGLHLTVLIIDDQATRGGGMGRKRGRNDGPGASPKVDNRFVFIGSYPRVVILHRSRRQHYNAVVIDGRPVVKFDQLPLNVRSLWPVDRIRQSEAKSESCSKSDLGNDDRMNGKEKMKECISEEGEKEIPSGHSGSNQNSTPSNVLEGKGSLSTLDSLPTQTLGKFYCGTAGFSSSHWVGNFYPNKIVGHNSDRQLDHYQQHFRTVEINSTFYGIPTESTVNKWKNKFSKSLRVVMKAPKGLTHEHPQLDCSVLSTFMSRMQPLHENLACILIQCPRTLAVTVSQLDQMKTMLDEEASWYKGCIAFEFRNQATYFDDEVRQFLKRDNFTLVMHPNSLGRSTIGSSASGRGSCTLLEYQPEQLSKVAAAGAMTSSLVYVRLHGFNDEHRGEYSMEQLKDIANQIHSWRTQGLEVFCFFLNDLEPTQSPSSPQKSALQPWDRWCAMPKNAKQLESFVYGMANEVIPDAPKKPKSTLLNFFGKKGV